MKKVKEPSQFFLNFIGEYIKIITNLDIKIEREMDGAFEREESPMCIEGYLLDEDKYWYYLGSYPDQVNQVMRKRDVSHISVMEIRTVYDEMLDTLPTPKERKEFN